MVIYSTTQTKIPPRIKSTGDISNLKNHLYLSKMVFGEKSKAVKWLKTQIDMYGENFEVEESEREYFAFLKSLHGESLIE